MLTTKIVDAIELGLMLTGWAGGAYAKGEDNDSSPVPITALMFKLGLPNIPIPTGDFDDRISFVNHITYLLNELGEQREAKGVRLGMLLTLYCPGIDSSSTEKMIELGENVGLPRSEITLLLTAKKASDSKGEGLVILSFIDKWRKLSRALRVFLSHGHNELLKLKLKNYIVGRLGYSTIILSEQPSQGLTIVEKLEKISLECNFAVILMTKDDENVRGGIRARQNVIHELGFFQGKYGRSRVVLLAEQGIEIFSNISGIVRIEFIQDHFDNIYDPLRQEFEKAIATDE